jgi:hypothetical protein
MTLQLDPLLLDVIPAATESDGDAKRSMADRLHEPAPTSLSDGKEAVAEALAGVWGY